MKTINNIFQLFKIISESHYQINGFVYGDINEVESYDKLKYPLLIASPILSVVSENVINHTYRISISDLVRKDEENQIEIWSDTQQILNDLIKVFRYDSVEFELIGEPILTPFKEKWGDDVSGWQADFEIQFSFDSQVCNVPIDTFLFQSKSCQDVTITDGETIIEVASGGTYTCSTGGTCDDASVTNSNATYNASVASGATLSLPNTSYSIYVNGVLDQTISLPTLDNSQTINITA